MDHLSEPEMEKLLILQQREIDAMQIALVQKQREAGMPEPLRQFANNSLYIEVQNSILSELRSKTPVATEMRSQTLRAALEHLLDSLPTKQERTVAQLILENSSLKEQSEGVHILHDLFLCFM